SCTLARALLGEGLVDELRLMVYPQVLGTGKRLLGDGVGTDAFRFAEVKQLGGVVATVLRRD
ncbi:MAG TPA: dihydrofolate reductase family protein, partial [Gaiellaceae bacterium]|nr:dihydrofolate reductase family protein [Gaiellaceae bacterium]